MTKRPMKMSVPTFKIKSGLREKSVSTVIYLEIVSVTQNYLVSKLTSTKLCH